MADYSDVAPAALHAGAVLRDAREARRLSVEDVAQTLKLTPRQVLAIEREEFDLLPGTTFARGFVRNYARLLQIDPAPLLAAIDLRLARGEVDLRPLSNAAGRMPAGGGSRGVPRWLLAGLALAVVALAVGVYVERFGPDMSAWQPAGSAGQAGRDGPATSGERLEIQTTAPAAEPAATVALAPPPAAPAAAAVEPQAAGPAAAPPGQVVGNAPAAGSAAARRLTFRFGKESWLEVRDGAGKLLTSGLNAPGSVLELEGQGPFELVVGNAASVELKLDDRSIDLKPHTSVSVARLRLE
jgi:cytoskeleton protein RodZ